MSEGKKTLYAIIVLQMIILVSAVLIGHSIGRAQPRDSSISSRDQFGMIGKAMLYIREKYREEDVDVEKLVYGSIKGMTEALGDPYSQFMVPEMYNDTMEDTSGKFGGLGIEIAIRFVNDYSHLTVMSPLDGSPAHKAGVEAGDYIVKIDGESTFGISLEKAKQRLRGKPGTKVTITVVREGEDEPIDIAVTRGVIELETVKFKILDNDIGYIRLSQFSDTTPEDFDKALDEFEKAKMKGIVLDLRANPGGTLPAAVEVASDFLSEDQLVVYTQGRSEEDYKEFRVQKGKPRSRLPLVVLVNQWSASGSEIVVGAIKDHKRGLIVGNEHSTFGKGSVQTIFPMPDGKSGLKLTVANYYTPSGKNINKVGIEPDIKYPDLTSSEVRIFRKLRSSESLDQFVKEAGDDNILKKLETVKGNGTQENPDLGLFRSFTKKLSQEDIVLSESLIKLAIAYKTENEVDEYEYDPVVRFAINHLRALEVLNPASSQ
jgi:carboxyl-terminal processing protease